MQHKTASPFDFDVLGALQAGTLVPFSSLRSCPNAGAPAPTALSVSGFVFLSAPWWWALVPTRRRGAGFRCAAGGGGGLSAVAPCRAQNQKSKGKRSCAASRSVGAVLFGGCCVLGVGAVLLGGARALRAPRRRFAHADAPAPPVPPLASAAGIVVALDPTCGRAARAPLAKGGKLFIKGLDRENNYVLYCPRKLHTTANIGQLSPQGDLL